METRMVLFGCGITYRSRTSSSENAKQVQDASGHDRSRRSVQKRLKKSKGSKIQFRDLKRMKTDGKDVIGYSI